MEVNDKKDKQVKKNKKITEKKYPIKTLIGFLNSNYRNMFIVKRITDGNDVKISGKYIEYISYEKYINSDKSSKNKKNNNNIRIIDLDNCKSVSNLTKIYNELSEGKLYKKKKLIMKEAINRIYDIRLRGLLEIASNHDLDKTKNKKEENTKNIPLDKVIIETILPQMQIQIGNMDNKYIDFANEINQLFMDNQKNIIRIFNAVFPHEPRNKENNTETKTKAMNLKYLQRCPSNYIEIMNQYINNNETLDNIIEIERNRFISTQNVNLSDIEQVRAINLFMKRDEITKIIRSDKPEIEFKNMVDLYNINGKRLDKTIQTKTIELIKYLNKVRHLLEMLAYTKNSEQERLEEYNKKAKEFKEIYNEEPPKFNTIKDLYEEFKSRIKIIKDFHREKISKKQFKTHKDLIIYMYEAVKVVRNTMIKSYNKFIEFCDRKGNNDSNDIKNMINNTYASKEKIYINSAIKMITDSINTNMKDMFKVDKSFRKIVYDFYIRKMIPQIDNKVKYILINDDVISTHSPLNMKIFYKIGKFIDIDNMNKKYRIIIGIEIVSYIIEETERLMIEIPGKKDRKIYIKTNKYRK